MRSPYQLISTTVASKAAQASAHGGLHLLEGGLHLLRIGDLAPHAQHALGDVAGAVGGRHLVAGAQQVGGDLAADALAAAGDEDAAGDEFFAALAHRPTLSGPPRLSGWVG